MNELSNNKIINNEPNSDSTLKMRKPKKQEKPKKTMKNDDNDEITFSFHITNLHTNCSIQKLFESLNNLNLGEVFQIIIHTKYNKHITEKEKDNDISRRSEAYVYYKSSKNLTKQNPFLKKILNAKNANKKYEISHLLDGVAWNCEINIDRNYHFRTDEYIQKRIIIQSICTSRNSNDINWIFREHGEVEQIDMVWVKSEQYELPSRCQSYIYFKEWGDEEYTYKLLDELNEVGVFTIKYDYKDYHDLLWVYELSPKSETNNEYNFDYGKYFHWIPHDDPKYGSRYDDGNKLNWFFTDEGRFAYSKRIVDDEIKKHGGLFIGPEKHFYKIEIERKPIEISWTTNGDNNNNIEIQKLILEALQKCLENSEISNKSKI